MCLKLLSHNFMGSGIEINMVFSPNTRAASECLKEHGSENVQRPIALLQNNYTLIALLPQSKLKMWPEPQHFTL